MKVRATLVNREGVSVTAVADVTSEGDLSKLTSQVYAEARKAGLDLWGFTLQVTKAVDAA